MGESRKTISDGFTARSTQNVSTSPCGRTLLSCGFIYKTKNWSSVDNHARIAIELSREQNDAYRLARALVVFGDSLFKQRKWQSALPYYQESAELTKIFNFKNRQLTATSRLARCFDILGLDKELVTCMKEVLAIQNELQITGEDKTYDFH